MNKIIDGWDTKTRSLKGYRTYIGATLTFIAVVTGVITPDEAGELTQIILGAIGLITTILGRMRAK